MKAIEQKKRISELSDFIAQQEKLLDDGSRRLKELNELYEDTYRSYKELVQKKNKLVEEIIILTSNVELYSNF